MCGTDTPFGERLPSKKEKGRGKDGISSDPEQAELNIRGGGAATMGGKKA